MHTFVQLRIPVFAVALLTLAAVVARPVAAAPTDKKPTDKFEVISVVFDDVVPADVCGFPINVHGEGWVKIRFPADSNRGVIEVDSVHIKVTWLNPANGKTSDVTESPTVTVVDNGDGTLTLVITGLQGRDTIPGAGRVTGDIGRVVFTIDAETGEFISELFSAGPRSFGPFPALCEYLA